LKPIFKNKTGTMCITGRSWSPQRSAGWKGRSGVQEEVRNPHRANSAWEG